MGDDRIKSEPEDVSTEITNLKSIEIKDWEIKKK
jgi:hypothetical protein